MPQTMAQIQPMTMNDRRSWMTPRMTMPFLSLPRSSMAPTMMVPMPPSRMQSTSARMPFGVRLTVGMSKRPMGRPTLHPAAAINKGRLRPRRLPVRPLQRTLGGRMLREPPTLLSDPFVRRARPRLARGPGNPMNLFEHQGRELYERYGIPCAKGYVVESMQDLESKIAGTHFPVVVKAQVLVGGRGKAGGVKFA